MNDDRILDALHEIPIEPERYELSEAPAYRFDLDRRDFFKFAGAGVLVVCVMRRAAAQQESGRGRQFGEQMPREIGAWLHIGETGVVTVFTGKTEVGQDIRTSLTQAVAEELRVPMARIRLLMADTDRVPYDAGTFGSRTTPTMNLQLRRVAAAARGMLIELAAQKWQVPQAQLVAASGRVTDSGNHRAVEFAELVKGRELAQTISAENELTAAAEWRVQGHRAAKVDGRDFVTGKHRYTTDWKLPGMLYGRILRPAAFEATLVSADTSAAQKMPSVTIVRDGNFIGVAARSSEEAARALEAIRAEWKSTAQPSSKEIFEYLKKNEEAGGQGQRGGGPSVTGDVEKALAEAEHRLSQTYTVAYIAHVPLETRAAVAEWAGDKLTVWTGTQRPFGVRGELAEAFRIAERNVRVIVPDTGSAYGGKHSGEMAVEAARLAKGAGKPVKLIWTREEEMTWAYFRPAGVIEVRTGARADGVITAWDFHNYNSGGAAIRPMYAFANQRNQFHRTRSPLRQGSYRGLAATANHFARETHLDEVARALKMDPLELRLKNLQDPRLRAVLEAAAKKFGWPAKPAPGRGYGIAGGFEKGSYVANCAEVSVERASGAVKIIRLVTAYECGAIVNPDHLKNQVEGAVIQGLGGALFEAVEFENGRILNARLTDYRLPRFSDVPPLETVLLDRKDLPSAGAGETPIVCVAPAIGNAIFDASGIRLRGLPLIPRGLKST